MYYCKIPIATKHQAIIPFLSSAEKNLGVQQTNRRSTEKKSLIFLTINPYLGSILTYQFQHILAIFRCSMRKVAPIYTLTKRAFRFTSTARVYCAPFNSQRCLINLFLYCTMVWLRLRRFTNFANTGKMVCDLTENIK